jgi:hypothetical protein
MAVLCAIFHSDLEKEVWVEGKIFVFTVMYFQLVDNEEAQCLPLWFVLFTASLLVSRARRSMDVLEEIANDSYSTRVG